MYNNISNAAKTALKSNVVTTTARITLTSDNTVIDGNNLQNITITDQCYQDGVIVGTAMCKEVEIELINNNYNLADKEFLLEVGVLLPNNNYEYIPYGNFIVKEYSKIVSSNHYKIIAYDYMDKFNATFIDNNATAEDGVTYITPMTLQSFYQYVATQYNVTLETQSNLPNANFSITQKPYFDGASGREVLSRIAEMMGCFAKINRNNKLEMRLKNVTTEQFSRSEMNNSLEIDDKFGPINVISLRLSQVEGENVTKRDEASIAQYGETVLQIQDNPFVYSEALRLLAINDIYNKVDGFAYYPTTFNGKLIYLDVGDEVEVQDMTTDNYYKTIILKQVLKIPSVRSSKFENKAITKTGLEHQYTPEQVRKDRRIEYLVDKQNGVIEALVETTEEIEKQVEDIVDTVGTASGKNIHIEDSSDQPIISAKLNGETSQATRSGKNLLINNAQTQTISDVTFTKNNDGSIKINGTNNSGSTITYNIVTRGSQLFKLNTGIYTLSGCTGGSNSTYHLYISDGTNAYRNNTTPVTFTISNDNTIVGAFINIASGKTVDTTIYPQIEQGSTATEYEPYGVMPSPEFPSPIINVEPRNLLNIQDKTDSKNGVDITVSNGEITLNGTASATTAFNLWFDYIFKANTTYTLSANNKTDNSNLILRFDSGNNFPIAINTVNRTNTFTPTNDINISAFVVRIASGGSFTNFKFKPMLELGTVATDYVPYNNLMLKKSNENLFNIYNVSYLSANYMSYQITNNLLDLTAITTQGAQMIGYIINNCNTTEKYTLSYKGKKIVKGTDGQSRIRIVVYGSNDGNTYTQLLGIGESNPVEGQEYSFVGTVTGYKHYRFFIYNNTSTPVTIGEKTQYWDIMFLQGEYTLETLPSYIEHQEETHYFPLGNIKLMQGSTLEDSGNHNTRKQIILNGTDDIAEYRSGTFNPLNLICFRIVENLEKNTNRLLAICSHFTIQELTTMSNNPKNGEFAFYTDNTMEYNRLYFCISYDIVGAVSTDTTSQKMEKVKTYLAQQYANGTPVTVEYGLVEEQVIPYTVEQQQAWNELMQMTTYKNITNIYSDASADIEYVKDNGLGIYEIRADAQRQYTTIDDKFAKQTITNESIKSEVSDTQTTLNNNYYNKTQVDGAMAETEKSIKSVEERTTVVEQTASAFNVFINNYNENGANKIKTTIGYTFDNEGLKINKTDAETGTVIDEASIRTVDKTGASNTDLFYAGYVKQDNEDYPDYRGQTIVYSKNMIVQQYLVVPGSRFETYENPILGGHGTGVFGV